MRGQPIYSLVGKEKEKKEHRKKDRREENRIERIEVKMTETDRSNNCALSFCLRYNCPTLFIGSYPTATKF